VKEAAENELEVGIRRFVREDGTVLGEAQMAWTVSMTKLRQGEVLQALARYRIRIRRLAQGLMDQISSVNSEGLENIMNQFSGIEPWNGEELRCIIQVIFNKAMAEPALCKACARMAVGLREHYLEFPHEDEDQKPVSFTRELLNICQEEFESMPATFGVSQEDKAKFPSAEALKEALASKKHRMLACVCFIGHLFLEGLLAMKVIRHIVHKLIGDGRRGWPPPEEPKLECALELLTLVGRTLDESVPTGIALMHAFQKRLLDLALLSIGDKHIFSDRARCAISDLLERRRNHWLP
ncbi:unnamed protein product, partial [Symbiodinium pilosum]